MQLPDKIALRNLDIPEDKSAGAASLASHYLYKGYQVGLVTSGVEVPLGIGMEQLYNILRILALLSPGNERGKLLARVEAGGILILPYDSGAWRGKEGAFSKVIKVTQ